MLPPSYSALLFHGDSLEVTLNELPCISTLKRTSSNTKNSSSGPNTAVSPMPDDFMKASARLAVERGQRE